MAIRAIRRPKFDPSTLSIEKQIELGFLDPADISSDILEAVSDSTCPTPGQKAGPVSTDKMRDIPDPSSEYVPGRSVPQVWRKRDEEIFANKGKSFDPDSCGRPQFLPSGEANPDWDPFEDPPEVRAETLRQRDAERARLVERQEALRKRGVIPSAPKTPPPPPPGMGMPEARFSSLPEEAPTKANHNPRTKKYMEGAGYRYEKVDHYDARTGRSHDLFGVFDGLAFGSKGLVGVQLTTATNAAARKAKIRKWAGLKDWFAAGCSVLVLAWEKEGARYVAREHWMRTVMD